MVRGKIFGKGRIKLEEPTIILKTSIFKKEEILWGCGVRQNEVML